MTYVIAEPCINVKDTSCVEVCPVDCIHPAKEEEGFDAAEQLYINPDECIDCGACESVCPVNAISSDAEVPEKWQGFTVKNANFFKQGR